MSTTPGPVRWRHVAVLVRTSLTNVTRAPLDTTTGKSRGHPVLAVLISNGLLGLLFSANTHLAADLRTYAILVFTAGLAMSALSLLPDTLELRQRRLDILYTRPVSDRSFAVASALNLCILAAIVLTAFSAVPWASARFELEATFGQLLRLWVVLVVAGFTVGIAFTSVLVFAARWFSVDGLRRVALAMLAVLMVGTSLLSSVVRQTMRGGGDASLDLAEHGWVRFLPSSWYVDLALGGPTGGVGLAPLALLATCGAIGVAVLKNLDAAHPRFAERLAAPTSRRPGRPVALRVVDLIFRTPLGAWLGGAEVRAVASLILLLTHREDVSRLRILALRLVTVVIAVTAILLDQPIQIVVLGGVLGIQNLAEGRSAATHSPNAAASWVFAAAPVRPRALVRGTALALLTGYQALTLLLMTVALFYERRWPTALAMSAAFTLLGLTISQLLIGASPSRPLAEEPRLAPVFTNLGWTLAFGTVHVLAYFSMTSLASAALAVPVFAATAVVAERWAVRRMASSMQVGGGR